MPNVCDLRHVSFDLNPATKATDKGRIAQLSVNGRGALVTDADIARDSAIYRDVYARNPQARAGLEEQRKEGCFVTLPRYDQFIPSTKR